MIGSLAAASVVLITLDDVSWLHFNAAMEKTMEVTQGRTVYPFAFACVPLCGPSRACLLTGQLPETTGIRGNEHGGNWGTGFIPEALRASGYRTMVLGKMPNGYESTPEHLGYSKYAILTELDNSRYFDAPIDVNGSLRTASGYVPDDLYRRTRNCISGARPFFCHLNALGAHAPADPAPRHRAKCDPVSFVAGPSFNEANMQDKPSWMRNLPLVDERRAKENWCEQVETLRADDDGVRSILDLVAGDSDVCVIVTADNGRMNGQHRLTGKSVLYEESINVPLVTWNCGGLGATDNRLVSNVDVAAHILHVAGVDALRPLDGRPLDSDPRPRVRILGGTDIDAAGWRRRNTVEWEYGNGEREEYDLDPDPFQINNRVSLRRRK